MMRKTTVAGCVTALVAMSLTGCAGGDLAGDEISLEQALAMVSADAVSDDDTVRFPTVSFAHVAELDDHEKWDVSISIAVSGGPVAEAPERVGFDYEAAEFAISTAGSHRGSLVSLLAGGQDADRIRDSLSELGYSGSDELTAPAGSAIESWAAQVRPDGDRVFVGGPEANFDHINPTLAPEDSLLYVWNTDEVIDCLGDQPLVQLSQWKDHEDESVLGVAATSGETNDTVTVCAEGDVAIGNQIAQSLTSNEPMPSAYEDANVEVVGDLVRVTFKLHPDIVPAGAVAMVPQLLPSLG